MSAEVGILFKALGVEETISNVRKVSQAINETVQNVETNTAAIETHKKIVDESSVSLKDLALGFSQLASGAFSLYQQYDRVQDMQVSVDRANLQVKASLNAVEDAQRRYNEAAEKYGVDSEKAQAAAKDLQLAQERYQVALERAEMMQGNLNETMAKSALTSIPMLISTVEGGIRVFGDLKSIVSSGTSVLSGLHGAVQAVSGVISFLASNPVTLAITAIAALVAGLIIAYQTCEPFRKAVNALGAALLGGLKVAAEAVIGALEWLWKNVFEPFGKFLVDVMVGHIKAMGAAWEWLNTYIIEPLRGALDWLWNGIFKPFGKFLADVMVGHVNAVSSALDWLNKHVVEPLQGALNWLWNHVLKPIADFLVETFKKAWEIATAPIKAFQELIDSVSGALKWLSDAIGGVVDWLRNLCFKHATPMVEDFNKQVEESIGLVEGLQSGLEGLRGVLIGVNVMGRVSPYMPVGGGNITITGPLVYIAGSADKATAEYAVKLVEQKLKTVLIESSSSAAPTKRIRPFTSF